MAKNKKDYFALDNSVSFGIKLADDETNPLLDMSFSKTQGNFIHLYLSKINPLEPESKQVVFTLEEYQTVMDIKRANVTQLKNVTESLLNLRYWEYCSIGENTFNNQPGFYPVTLYDNDKTLIYKDKDPYNDDKETWYITLSCSNKAEKCFFEFKVFADFEVWNILALREPMHRRVYIFLKPYEKLKQKELTIKELRKELRLKDNQYVRWNNLKALLLDKAKVKLKEKTDIFFNYEVIERRGKGGTAYKLRFNVYTNHEVKNQPRQLLMHGVEESVKEELNKASSRLNKDLQAFADVNPDNKKEDFIDVEYEEVKDNIAKMLFNACNGEYKIKQIESLIKLVPEDVGDVVKWVTDRYEYMRNRRNILKGTKNEIENPYAYLRHIITKKNINAPSKKENSAVKSSPSAPTQEELNRMQRLLKQTRGETDEKD